MPKVTLKIVIVGHVDHGKSTLIGRLLLDTGSLSQEKLSEIKRIAKELGKDTELAFLTDQLREEREQDKTIDTTQIFFKSRARNYVIIDAPGHLEFIKNMLSGASLAEAGVLIIDVSKGLQEQTRRHAYLLSLLGIKKIVVVLNKMDLVNYEKADFEKVKIDLLKFLDGLAITPGFIIPASAKTGANISKKSLETPWYKGPGLLGALDSLQSEIKIEQRPLRFAVQDIYETNGERIVAGKVISGNIYRNQEVAIHPTYAHAKIKALKVFGQKIKKARAGQNIGLILDNALAIKRGDIVSAEGEPVQLKDTFVADIFWMAKNPLRLREPLVLRCSTQEISCQAEKIEKRIDSSTLEILQENAQELKELETGQVVLRTERPIIAEKFDFIEELGRFVLERDYNLQGAGIITRLE
jgi:small GTP-binding protein